jgi:hypothetical protein
VSCPDAVVPRTASRFSGLERPRLARREMLRSVAASAASIGCKEIRLENSVRSEHVGVHATARHHGRAGAGLHAAAAAEAAVDVAYDASGINSLYSLPPRARAPRHACDAPAHRRPGAVAPRRGAECGSAPRPRIRYTSPKPFASSKAGIVDP